MLSLQETVRQSSENRAHLSPRPPPSGYPGSNTCLDSDGESLLHHPALAAPPPPHPPPSGYLERQGLDLSLGPPGCLVRPHLKYSDQSGYLGCRLLAPSGYPARLSKTSSRHLARSSPESLGVSCLSLADLVSPCLSLATPKDLRRSGLRIRQSSLI
jgi:hypothetical protein